MRRTGSDDHLFTHRPAGRDVGDDLRDLRGRGLDGPRRLDLGVADAEALADEPRAIAMDPYVSFGRPMLVGTGIPTAIVAERYKAGESIQELAYDYDLLPSLIEEAIRCELEMKAA